MQNILRVQVLAEDVGQRQKMVTGAHVCGRLCTTIFIAHCASDSGSAKPMWPRCALDFALNSRGSASSKRSVQKEVDAKSTSKDQYNHANQVLQRSAEPCLPAKPTWVPRARN